MNMIIQSDKCNVPKLIQQLKVDLDPPADVEEELTTAGFLVNKYAFCPVSTKENVMQNSHNKVHSIYWSVD